MIEDINYVITFGKFKDKTIADVLRESPMYLVWAHENVKDFKLAENIIKDALHREATMKRLERNRRDRYRFARPGDGY